MKINVVSRLLEKKDPVSLDVFRILFGLILFLFARESTLNLRWDGSLWPAFIVLSLPSLWIGWRLLSGLEEEVVRSSSKIVAQLNETDAFNE